VVRARGAFEKIIAATVSGAGDSPFRTRGRWVCRDVTARRACVTRRQRECQERGFSPAQTLSCVVVLVR